MSITGFLLGYVGRKFVLAASIIVAFFGVVLLAVALELTLGYNVLQAPVVIGNTEIDMILPLGVALSLAAAVLYFRLISWLVRLRRLEEERIELRLRE